MLTQTYGGSLSVSCGPADFNDACEVITKFFLIFFLVNLRVISHHTSKLIGQGGMMGSTGVSPTPPPLHLLYKRVMNHS